MTAFDAEHDSILQRIRGMALLSNVLTFVDKNILPKASQSRKSTRLSSLLGKKAKSTPRRRMF